MARELTLYESEILYRVVDQFDVKGFPDLLCQQLERVGATNDHRFRMLLVGGTRAMRDQARTMLNTQLHQNGFPMLPMADEDDVRGAIIEANEN